MGKISYGFNLWVTLELRLMWCERFRFCYIEELVVKELQVYLVIIFTSSKSPSWLIARVERRDLQALNHFQ